MKAGNKIRLCVVVTNLQNTAEKNHLSALEAIFLESRLSCSPDFCGD